MNAITLRDSRYISSIVLM